MKTLYWRFIPIIKRGLLKILKKCGLLKHINLEWFFSINSVNFKIPIIQGIGYDNVFMTEMWMVEVLKQILPLKPGVFLDVGANIGQTLLKLRSVSKTDTYLGLEPNPTCAAYMGNLLRANRFNKSIFISVGLHNSRDLLELSLFAEGNTVDSGATLVTDPAFRPLHPVVFKQPVPVFPYQDITKFLDGAVPGIVKIDVEGGELEVLDSLCDMIRIEHPFILVEILPMGCEQDTLIKNVRIETFFSELKYFIYRIEKDGERFVRLGQLNNIGVNTDPTGWDYLAIPSESLALIPKNLIY